MRRLFHVPAPRGRGWLPLLLLLALCSLGSCRRILGYGVLLWSLEDPPIPSGTVLPVYIRSNLDKVWVVGIPRQYQDRARNLDKFEIPLSKLELVGSKSKAEARARDFAPFARIYAETLQDGLPIREEPENNSRRVYRLRIGEIIKVLQPLEGTPAVGVTGEPLPGTWYQVLAEDGTIGCCFSYRLKVFEHTGGPLAVVPAGPDQEDDPELDRVLSLTWSPESYWNMLINHQIDLEELSFRYGFDPGADSGTARIYVPGLDLMFSYTGIRSLGRRSWIFEGAPLQMILRSDTTLAVQYNEAGAAQRTLLFVALPQEVDDLIVQETTRREELFQEIYALGPAFSSSNYGSLAFSPEGRFIWTGYELLIPQVIPAAALESGSVEMGLFLGPGLEGRYSGALSLRFDVPGSYSPGVTFLYTLDDRGLRLEYVPRTNLNGVVVTRRAASPQVIYFYKADYWSDGLQ
jgi:hypothetical protein